jgi:hypothetical protein
MGRALDILEAQWKGRRRPKAFYLVEADWAEFLATDPPKARFPFGNNPPAQREEPAFRGLPVRLSDGKASRLYDHTTNGRSIPPRADA